ncbi:MAG: lipase family protein [Gordonia sp. (in: high G+C Gram-positive bacteria)]
MRSGSGLPSMMARTLTVAVCTLLTVAGCGNTGASSTPPPVVGYQTTPPRISAAALHSRGQVVATTGPLALWVSALPAGTRATRITYRSTSGIDGSPHLVTGAVFVPPGGWPAGGWPLIVYAHGTTGITRDCAPSDRPDMFGDLFAVAANLAAGYAVVTTDYQGIGVRADEPAPHPYLEPRTAAYNLIDAARAARSIEPTIGPRWVVAGSSQGGAAAWATAEQFASYGSGTPNAGQLAGAVAMSPVLDLSFLPELAQRGTLTNAQRYLYPIVVAGVAHTDSQLDTSALLHGVAANRLATLISCSTGKTALAAQVQSRDPATFTPTNSHTQAEITSMLTRFSLPRTATDIPILAIYGSLDDITPVGDMEKALGRGCSLGDHLVRLRREGQGHSLDPGPFLGQWVRDRVNDAPEESDC